MAASIPPAKTIRFGSHSTAQGNMNAIGFRCTRCTNVYSSLAKVTAHAPSHGQALSWRFEYVKINTIL